jgi:hypothetical protein
LVTERVLCSAFAETADSVPTRRCGGDVLPKYGPRGQVTVLAAFCRRDAPELDTDAHGTLDDDLQPRAEVAGTGKGTGTALLALVARGLAERDRRGPRIRVPTGPGLSTTAWINDGGRPRSSC